MMWLSLARFLAKPAVVNWLIDSAIQTLYFDITSADGADVYIGRYWLFNPYPVRLGSDSRVWWRRLLPSARVYRRRHPDQDRHMHDQPWNACTFILRGGCTEERRMATPWDKFERLDVS